MTNGSSTRFTKGKSGNPKGRPRRLQAAASAFDIVIDQVLTVMQNDVARELTIDEALQQKTYQDAIGGNRSARREILKMIAKRETWLMRNKLVKQQPVEVKSSVEGRTADDALQLLGIAVREERIGYPDTAVLLKLAPWVTQLCLTRGARQGFEDKDIAQIRRSTRADPEIEKP